MAKKKRTPEEIAEDEARTTSVGLFNRAEAYWLSATALWEAKVKHGHAHSPVGSLYYFAIELYLKAFLRQNGHTVEELSDGKRFGHKTDVLSARAKKLGLAFDENDKELFEIMGTSDVVIRSRYIRTGAARWPTFETLNATCENLREDIGRALIRAGAKIRLSAIPTRLPAPFATHPWP
jgi:hypothetical protein